MKIHPRAPWIVLAAAALITGLACDLGSSGGSSSTATSGPTSAPTTAAPTSASPSPAKLILKTPQAAAEHLYNAWKANDKATAKLGATVAAVDKLFTKTWTSGTYFFGGCTVPTGPSQCQYNYASGAIMMNINGNATTGFTVISVSFGLAG